MSTPAAAPAAEPAATFDDAPVVDTSVTDPALNDHALNQAALALLDAAAPGAEPAEPAEPAAPAAPAAPAEPAAPATPAAPVVSEPAVAPAVQQPPAPDAALEARIAEFTERQANAQRERQELAAATQLAEQRAAAAEQRVAELVAAIQANPLDVLKQHGGWELEALNRHAISGRTPEAVALNRVQQELADLRAGMTQAQQEAEQARAREDEQRSVTTMVTETIPNALKPDAAKLPSLSKMYEPHEVAQMVYQLMAASAQRARANPGSGARIPTPSEAAATLEAQLVARLKRMEAPVSGTPAPAEVKQPVATPSPKPAGLTNAITPATPPTADDDLSDEALNRKALQALAAAPR